MLDIDGCLPKNLNGIRTTHTCELCGFEPKTKNKYREKQDHLVMKHFKAKIDTLFPQSKPYACPMDGCVFVGKDKQALLRHYTGKHGILERYLKEALAENGIHYMPTDHRAKRRGSVLLTPSAKMAKTAITPLRSVALLDHKIILPKQPLPTRAPIQNTQELRKEVEALMASPIIINLLNQTPMHQQTQVQLTRAKPVKVIELPQQPLLPEGATLKIPNSILSLSPQANLLNCNPSPFAPTPAMPMTPALPMVPLPLELIAAQTDANPNPPGHMSAITSPSLFSSSSPIIDNKEVMWGGGVIEDSDAIPITYIDTIDGNYAAMQDPLDCDLLMPSINSLEPIKERQLNFCTY